jgi:hypothetical protein
MCDVGDRGALPSRGAWADTGARDRTRDAHLLSIPRRRCRPEHSLHFVMVSILGFFGLCRKVQFLGQNPKIGYQEFNELQTLKHSKKQLCDRAAYPHPAQPR